MPKKSSEKTVLFTIRAPAWQIANWKAAARILGDPERGGYEKMNASKFIRLALNDAAEEVFSVHGQPNAEDLLTRYVKKDEPEDG